MIQFVRHVENFTRNINLYSKNLVVEKLIQKFSVDIVAKNSSKMVQNIVQLNADNQNQRCSDVHALAISIFHSSTKQILGLFIIILDRKMA